MSTRDTTLAITGRSLKLIPRLPSTFIPSLVMPVFLTIVFSGGFSGISNLPGFPARETIDWFVPMATLMGAGFAGITTGMGVARDLEIGFYDRLLASPATRGSLLGGALLAAMLRALLPVALVTLVAVIGGAGFPAGVATIWPVMVAAFGVALCAGAWSLGIALRFKTLQSAPLMQVGFFLVMFLSTAQMPLGLLSGWLHDIARFNPMTNILALARQGYLGEITWGDTWPGVAALAGMFVVLYAFAARGMRKVTA